MSIDEQAFQSALIKNSGATYSDAETAFRDFINWYEAAKVVQADAQHENSGNADDAPQRRTGKANIRRGL